MLVGCTGLTAFLKLCPMRSTIISTLVILAAVACGTTETTEDASLSFDDELRTYRPRSVETFPRQDGGSGFYIQGEEYWPWKEAQPIYPNKVQWGYEAGSAPAKKCTAAAKTALLNILRNPPAELVAMKAKTGIDTFFLWNQDYTGARADGIAGAPILWLYEGGLMKWMHQTNRDGTCILPEAKDLRALARDCNAKYVQGQKTQCNARDTSGL